MTTLLSCPAAVACAVVLGTAYGASQPQASAQVRAGLERLSRGTGDLASFSVTYDDLHGLHGGLLLSIHGDGRSEQKAVRTEVRETRRVSPADLQRLIALVRELQAWEQRTPERDPIPDESRSRLTIRVDGAETTIWEWYNDMGKNARIGRVRDLMTEIAWVLQGE